MKNFNLLLLSVITCSLVSCASSGFVYLDYPQEPELILPESINNIAVVNRSLTKEEDKGNKTLESIATGEIAGSDKLASDEAVKGFFDGLQNSNHLKAVIPPTVRLYGTGTRKTPEILSWDQVNDICESANADVLLVLENFDSNSDFVIANAVNQVTSVLETGRTNTRFPRRARVNVRSFWRLFSNGLCRWYGLYPSIFYQLLQGKTRYVQKRQRQGQKPICRWLEKQRSGQLGQCH